MACNLGVLEGDPPVRQIRRDPRRPERVQQRVEGGKSRRGRPLDHGQHDALRQRPRGQALPRPGPRRPGGEPVRRAGNLLHRIRPGLDDHPAGARSPTRPCLRRPPAPRPPGLAPRSFGGAPAALSPAKGAVAGQLLRSAVRRNLGRRPAAAEDIPGPFGEARTWPAPPRRRLPSTGRVADSRTAPVVENRDRRHARLPIDTQARATPRRRRPASPGCGPGARPQRGSPGPSRPPRHDGGSRRGPFETSPPFRRRGPASTALAAAWPTFRP